MIDTIKVREGDRFFILLIVQVSVNPSVSRDAWRGGAEGCQSPPKKICTI